MRKASIRHRGWVVVGLAFLVCVLIQVQFFQIRPGVRAVSSKPQRLSQRGSQLEAPADNASKSLAVPQPLSPLKLPAENAVQSSAVPQPLSRPREDDAMQGFAVPPKLAQKQTAGYPGETLIHIVTTRFMQDQGHLVKLGLARLVLFETFCLPSIASQTILGNAHWKTFPPFLWIIRMDPELDLSIRQKMQELVEPYPFVYLVASNFNKKWLWRSGEAGSEFLGSKIYTGNVSWLQQAHASRNSSTILHTMLDSDDGLHSDFLEKIQKEAMVQLRLPGNSNKEGKQWKYWCVDEHVEWNPAPPGVYQQGSEHGLFTVRRLTKYCITPGLTLGISPHVLEATVLKARHSKLFKLSGGDSVDCGGETRGGCVTFVAASSPQAVRARTTTSAGMSDIVLDKDAFKKKAGRSSRAAPADASIVSWIQQCGFGLQPTKVSSANRHLQDNFVDIAEENLKGQCTPGNSCKNQAKESLTRVLGEPTAEGEENEDEEESAQRSGSSRRKGRRRKGGGRERGQRRRGAVDNSSLSLSFVGDIAFRSWTKDAALSMPMWVRRASGNPISATARQLIIDADLALGTLETPAVWADDLSVTRPAGWPNPSSADPARTPRGWFTATDRDVAELAPHFHGLTLANNHQYDVVPLGPTASIVERVGMVALGSVPGDSGAGVVQTMLRGGWRVGVLATNAVTDVPWPCTNIHLPSGVGPCLARADSEGGDEGEHGFARHWLYDDAAIDASVKALEQARPSHHLLVVLVHWGVQFQDSVEPRQRRLAQRWADAGADLVVGAHPHRNHGVEVLGGSGSNACAVFYSLGSFVGLPLGGRVASMLLTVTMVAGKRTGSQRRLRGRGCLTPASSSKGKAIVMKGERAEDEIARVESLSRSLDPGLVLDRESDDETGRVSGCIHFG